MAGRSMARHKANAEAEGRTIACLDESGFYLLPCTQSTYSPVGETPILRSPCSRDHLSSIGAVTPDGRLFMQTYEHSIKSEQFTVFLDHLLRHIDGRLLVMVDGSPIHRSNQVKEYLSCLPDELVRLERFPAYAPELNPIEGIWRYDKYVELANVCCQDVEHLKREHRLAKERLRHKKHVLKAAFVHAGLVHT